MKYVKGLDTLRAFAVIVVVLAHWWIPMDINDSHKGFIFWFKGLIPDGGFGVDLFFVLSGFLITGILLDAIKKDGDKKWKIIKNFIVRRALRIFPIYYLTIALLIWIGYPFIKDHLLWFLLYISNIEVFRAGEWNAFSHTWSLSVEEQFYLIWPWFIVFCSKKYLKYVLSLSILIGVFTAVYVIKIEQKWMGYVLMPTCMQAFGIGGLYAYLNKTGNLKLFLKCMKIVLPLAFFLHFHWSFSGGAGDNGYLDITLNSIISIWLIHIVLNNKSEWARKYILENFVLNKIGQVSYGIYLFHFVFGFIYEKIITLLVSPSSETGLFLLDWKNAYFIKVLMLFCFSLLSFYLVEKPILKLKRFFEY